MNYLSIRYFFLSIILNLLSAFISSGQQFPHLTFETLNTENGLSNNEVTCFYKDKSGFLWVGTKNGLNKFDGNQFFIYKNIPGNINSISGNQIVQVLQDSSGIFWIATKDGGLTRYDPEAVSSKRFKQFVHNPVDNKSIATNRLNCLYDYNSEYLLIGSEEYSGIFINKKTFAFSYYSWPSKYFNPQSATPLPGGSQKWIHQIKDGPGNNMLVGFHTPAQIFAVSKIENVPYRDTFYYGKGLSVPCFYPDGDTIWMGSWSDGLYFQLMKSTLKHEYSSESQGTFSNINDLVTSITNYETKYLLVGTKSKGLFLVDKKNGRAENYLQIKGDVRSLASNKILCIYNDNNRVFWIGTENGISKLNIAPKKFNINILSAPDLEGDLSIFSIHEDKDSTLRVCTSHGIFTEKKNSEIFSFTALKFKDQLLPVTTIADSKNERYFLGTERYLFSYNPLIEKIEPIPIDMGHAGISIYDYRLIQVRTILFDTINKKPGLWIGLLGDGVQFLDRTTNKINTVVKNNSEKNSIGNNLVRKLFLDHNKNLWVATSGGLFRLNKKTIPLENDFTSYMSIPNDTNTLSSNDIRDIIEDENNLLWIATNGGELNMYDGKRFHQYKGALSSSMFSLVFDDKHRLWISTSDGIEVFLPATKKFLHLMVNNGKDYNGNPSAFLKKKDGRLCIGSGNNLITFDPDSVLTDFSFPKIYLTGIDVMNKDAPDLVMQTEFTLPYNFNFLSFHFSSLSLVNDVTPRYQYKLIGLNDQWNLAGKDNQAVYTSLPPNQYTLLIKSTNAIGEWSNEYQLISFTINPPYWLRWWFILTMIILIVSVLYMVIKYRLNRLIEIHRIRNQIANDLHDEVGSALSTISLYTEVARMKNNSQNGLNEVLEKITLISQDMQENMSHIVWSLQPRNDQFDKVLLKMKNYSNEILGSKNIPVIFNAPNELLTIKLKGQNRRELFLIFKEAIQNISKYSLCSQVVINLKRSGKNLEMEIIDNGKGFKTEEVISGNGLHSMKERSVFLAGKLNITSVPEEGTMVHLVFPV